MAIIFTYHGALYNATAMAKDPPMKCVPVHNESDVEEAIAKNARMIVIGPDQKLPADKALSLARQYLKAFNKGEEQVLVTVHYADVNGNEPSGMGAGAPAVDC